MAAHSDSTIFDWLHDLPDPDTTTTSSQVIPNVLYNPRLKRRRSTSLSSFDTTPWQMAEPASQPSSSSPNKRRQLNTPRASQSLSLDAIELTPRPGMPGPVRTTTTMSSTTSNQQLHSESSQASLSTSSRLSTKRPRERDGSPVKKMVDLKAYNIRTAELSLGNPDCPADVRAWIIRTHSAVSGTAIYPASLKVRISLILCPGSVLTCHALCRTRLPSLKFLTSGSLHHRTATLIHATDGIRKREKQHASGTSCYTSKTRHTIAQMVANMSLAGI